MEEEKSEKQEIDRSMYWDINKTLSYNALFNFIVGARGCGKTYGCIKRAIDNFLKKKQRFVYLRRFEDELKECLPSLFNAVMREYPDHCFSQRGRELFIDGAIAGYGFALTTARKYKSLNYPDVSLIIFDEFIIDTGNIHYLKNEVVAFFECYETISRMRTVPVFFISNALTMYNPYFTYFNISLPYGKKNIIVKDDILIEICQNDKYKKAKKDTRFGKLIADTEYGKYAIDNEFLLDNKDFIGKKTATAGYYYTIVWNGEEYGIYIDPKNYLIFVSTDVDSTRRPKWTLQKEDHTLDTVLLNKKGFKMQMEFLITAFEIGTIRFENQKVKKAMYEMFNKIM